MIVSLYDKKKGSLLALARIQFNDFNTLGKETNFRSSLYLPGKFIRNKPIKIVKIPWPGSTSINKPNKIKINPSRFLIPLKNCANLGWLLFELSLIRRC